jgi:manganese/zinc/iron transport system substrate-binding protein
MKRFALLTVFLCLLLSAFTGCRGHDAPKTYGGRKLSVLHTHQGSVPIKAVCTTGMVADLVRNIGKEFVQVEQLMGEGVDPHLYKVNSDDVAKLNSANVIFYSGLHLEGKMTDVLERLAEKTPSFPVTEYLAPASILTDDHKHPDPHVWFDVALWSEVAGVIADALSMYDPPHATAYKKNAEAYRQELAKLHEETKNALAQIQPKEKRVLVTSHDAFRYFGRAYDIDVRGIQGISTDTEAGVREVNKLVNFLIERKVKAVFVETSVNQRSMRALQEGCKAQGHEVGLGGELFSDAMGKDGTPEGTYIGMVRHNAETIAKALR